MTGPDGGPLGFAVTTNRYDNTRNGANLYETTLNVANVGGPKFGLQFTRQVDGHMYAQPLYLPNLMINGATHNVVFVATENDSVYAFDADSPTAIAPLWKVSLGTSVPLLPSANAYNLPLSAGSNMSCRDMFPRVGITSTPVIDRATGRMYVVAETQDSPGVFAQRLHALDVLTGMEVAGSPVTIQGSVPGTAIGNVGGVVAFDPFFHLNRPGLLLNGGNVYIAFSSHCDMIPNQGLVNATTYHGWVFSYAADSLKQTGILNTTPNGTKGGIWQSGMGLVADAKGDVYIVVGNGDIDPANTGAELGLSVARLSLTPTGLKTMDWWTAFNATALNASDVDLTSAAVLLPNPNVIVAGGKDGNLYVLDPANLGKFSTASNNILQTFKAGAAHIHGGPVYWNGPQGPTIYAWPEGGTVRAFGFTGKTIKAAAVSMNTSDSALHPGGILSLSADGNKPGTGIVWATFTNVAVDTPAATPGHAGDAWHWLVHGAFYAFDATNLTTPIWKSTTNRARDDIGIYAKFDSPMVANGRVYIVSQATASTTATGAVGEDGRLLVYGLLP